MSNSKTEITNNFNVTIVGNIPTLEKAGAIAVKMSEEIVPPLTAKEQSFFVAGFQECIKYLNQN